MGSCCETQELSLALCDDLGEGMGLRGGGSEGSRYICIYPFQPKLFYFILFYFIVKLYIIVLVLPNIKMNLPQVHNQN